MALLSSRRSRTLSANLRHQPVNSAHDPLLDVGGPAIGRPAVFVEVAAFVAALLPDATGGDIGHTIVRVAGGPGPGTELLLEPERVVHHRFPPEGDPELLFAQAPDLH